MLMTLPPLRADLVDAKIKDKFEKSVIIIGIFSFSKDEKSFAITQIKAKFRPHVLHGSCNGYRRSFPTRLSLDFV